MKGPAWYVEDRSALVADGDPRAAFLAAGPGDDVPTDVPWLDREKPQASATKKPVKRAAAKPKS